jgi:hypothetical protein
LAQFTPYTRKDRDFQGQIDNIRKVLHLANRSKLDLEIAKSIAISEREIHFALREQVKQTFGDKHKLGDVYKTYRTSNYRTMAKRVITRGFLYEHKPRNITLFPISYYWGNLRQKKRRQGWVHLAGILTEVGQQKVYGANWRNKKGFGGFTPRDKEGNILYRREGYPDQMFVRLTRDPYPLKLIFGPSLADMAAWCWRQPGLPLQYALANAVQRIEKIALAEAMK